MRNLGPISSDWLRNTGINTIQDLERHGPVVAFRLVKQRRPRTRFNLLWSLEAGLRCEDWRELAEATKKRLIKETEQQGQQLAND